MELLYKYRSWSNVFHQNVLLNNQLFFSAPKDMNDPFDFRIPSDYSLLDTDEKKVAFIIKNYKNLSVEQKQKFGTIDSFISKNLHLFKTNLPWVQSYFEGTEASRTDDHFGVLCFSLVWDNVLMWTHYGENHKGFCVGFDKQKFTDSNIFGCGPVHYDKFPSIDPLNTDPIEESIMKSHYKAPDWKYEKEYRITTVGYPKKLTIDDRTYTYPDDFLMEIIIGLNISSDHKSEIVNIANKREIPVYQIKKKSLSFTLLRELIN